MKILFIETSMGASGDMLLGSLIGLLPDPEGFLEKLRHLGLEGLTVERKIKTSMGIAGNRIKVCFHGQSEAYDHDDDKEAHNHHEETHDFKDGCDHPYFDANHSCCCSSDTSEENEQAQAQIDSEHSSHSTVKKEQTIALAVSEKKTSSKCCGHFDIREDGSKTCCKHSHSAKKKHEEESIDRAENFDSEYHREFSDEKAEKEYFKHKKEKHRKHRKECCDKKSKTEKHHKHHHEDARHAHNDLATLGKMIDTLAVDDTVKTQAKEIYQILAEAEAIAHNKPSSQIHFHELGEKDAVFDIVAVCLAMKELGAQKIYATPIHVGYGKVKTAHGKLPVPTPATAEILKGIPIYSKDIKGELCTPTGAALLKYFVHEFRQMPPATWERIGYGIGSKEFKEPNILRAFFGESE